MSVESTPQRSGGGSSVLDALILIAVMAIAWQLSSLWLGEAILPGPLQTVRDAGAMLSSERFWTNAAVSSKAFLMGLAISVAAGLSIGLVFGQNKLAGEAGEPILMALYTIPKVSFYPIILLFFGIGLAGEVAFGALHGIIPIAIFTMSGVRNVKPVYLKMARSLGLRYFQTMTTMIIPAAMPEIFTGLRVGFSLTLIGTLLSEMFGSKAGLGFMLMNAMGLNLVKIIMSLTLLLVVFAAIVNGLLLMIDNRLHRRV